MFTFYGRLGGRCIDYVYRFLSEEEFNKLKNLNFSITRDENHRPRWNDISEYCFLPEILDVEGHKWHPLQAYWDFLGGIVSDDYLVKFKVLKPVFEWQTGQYSSFYQYDPNNDYRTQDPPTFMLKELRTAEYNSNTLKPVGYLNHSQIVVAAKSLFMNGFPVESPKLDKFNISFNLFSDITENNDLTL